MTEEQPSAPYNGDYTAAATIFLPNYLSTAHVTWCTCGVISGGVRDPRPNCPMHSGQRSEPCQR